MRASARESRAELFRTRFACSGGGGSRARHRGGAWSPPHRPRPPASAAEPSPARSRPPPRSPAGARQPQSRTYRSQLCSTVRSPGSQRAQWERPGPTPPRPAAHRRGDHRAHRPPCPAALPADHAHPGSPWGTANPGPHQPRAPPAVRPESRDQPSSHRPFRIHLWSRWNAEPCQTALTSCRARWWTDPTVSLAAPTVVPVQLQILPHVPHSRSHVPAGSAQPQSPTRQPLQRGAQQKAWTPPADLTRITVLHPQQLPW